MAAHRKLDRRRVYLCAGESRERAFFLATVTGIALERFDALTRDMPTRARARARER
jgi:hypothetical protein